MAGRAAAAEQQPWRRTAEQQPWRTRASQFLIKNPRISLPYAAFIKVFGPSVVLPVTAHADTLAEGNGRKVSGKAFSEGNLGFSGGFKPAPKAGCAVVDGAMLVDIFLTEKDGDGYLYSLPVARVVFAFITNDLQIGFVRARFE